MADFNLAEIFNKSIEDVKGPLVYRIYYIPDGTSYVGSTMISLLYRFVTASWSHKVSSSECNSKLYNAIRNLGVSNFNVSILGIYPECNKTELLRYEAEYVKLLDSYINGYNQTPDGNGLSSNVDSIQQSYRGRLAAAKNRKECKGIFFNKELHAESLKLQRESESGIFNPELRSMVGRAGLTAQLNSCIYKYSYWLTSQGYEVNESNWNLYKTNNPVIPYSMRNKLLRWKKASTEYPGTISQAINDCKKELILCQN